jgi:hypothetical protein
VNIDELIERRHLDQVEHAPEYAATVLGRAEAHIAAANLIVEIDPLAAYQLAYDAAWESATTMRAIRPAPHHRGGHVAVVSAIHVLDVTEFDRLDPMRRRRHQLGYPGPNDLGATPDDARTTIEWARSM